MPAPSSTVALSLAGLRKSLANGRILFDALDLEVAPGEIVAITGESGVGKSTLLNVIAGLDSADAGRVAIEGVDLGTLDEDGRTIIRRDRIGFVFQAFHILPHLTLRQNVALPLILQHEDRDKALARASRLLEEVGLQGRDHDAPRHLSGGELQRVAIARALVHRPPLLLADEPTGNLDPETADRILDLFVRQAREARAATLIVTHSEVAAAAADRRLRLTRRHLS